MKKTWRFLSYVLASAVLVTSVPSGYSTTIYAAEPGQEQTQNEGENPQTEDKNLLRWNMNAEDLQEGESLSEDGNIYTRTQTFDAEDQYVNASVSVYSDSVIVSADDAKDAWSIQEDMTDWSISDVTFHYQWYMEDAQGDREKLVGEMSSSLGYDADESYHVKAADGIEKYICEISLAEVIYEDDNYDEHTYLAENLAEGYTATVEQVFTYQYTGLTKEDFDNGTADIADYFEGTETGGEEEKELSYAGGTVNLYMSDVCAKGSHRLNYIWIVNYADNTREELEGGYSMGVYGVEPLYNVGSRHNGRLVKNYECRVELCYNGIVVKELSKKFRIVYNPITVYTPAETTVDCRANGKQTFTVDADINDTEICRGILYQWYQVKGETETKLEGETADTLKVKITDPAIAYKCVVTGRWNEGYTSDWSRSVVFRVNTVPGYRLHDRSNRYVYLDLNEETELFVDASVDTGYALTYKWERVDAAPEGSAEEYVFTSVGTESKLKVKPVSAADWQEYYIEDDDESYRYRLTVSAARSSDNQVMGTWTYYYSIREKQDEYEETTSEGLQNIFYGDSAEVFVKAKVNDNYTIKQDWYYLIDSQAYYENYNSETDNYEVVFAQKDFKEPIGDDIISQDEYDDYRQDENGIYRNYYIRSYYKKLDSSYTGAVLSTDGSTLSVPSLKESVCYCCVTGVYEKEKKPEGGSELLIHWYDNKNTFRLNVKSDLSAYAKNDTVQCSVGEKADLEVVAQNFNASLRPLTYTWKKYEEEKGQYVELANKTAVYSIASVKESDYGRYQVEVSDQTETKTLTIYLEKAGLNVVVYTPTRSYYNKKIGDTVELAAELSVPAGVNVFYEWYHMESTYEDEEVDWEIIGQDANKYQFTLDDAKKYGTYKCVATYKDGNSSVSRTFYYEVNSVYQLSSEPTTPSVQYKRIGDSATYAVRAMTNDPTVTEAQIKYQWCYRNEDWEEVPIEGATSSTYTISKLAGENFREIYCKISVVDAGNEVVNSTYTSFQTYLYSDIRLENPDAEIEAEQGSDVTLEPSLVNPENQTLTYQWYRVQTYYDEEDGEYYDSEPKLIYGATGKSYTISKIGENEFGKYVCDIFMEGAKLETYTVSVKKSNGDTTLTAGPENGLEETIRTAPGKSVRMAVKATSNKNLPVKYQWYNNEGDAIGGATSASYEIAKITPGDFGDYRCMVTDSQGNTANVWFTVRKTANLNVETGSMDTEDEIGYETSFGENVTLKATAASDPAYNIFYQWYKYEDGGEYERIMGATDAEFTISNVSEKDLGRYRCQVYNEVDDDYYLDYYVYVNTGLVVEPGCPVLYAAGDGTVRMYVDARANSGETISYQWFMEKYNEETEEDELVPIAGADQSSYSLSSIKKENYGQYVCKVSTGGESYTYSFTLYPECNVASSSEYAQKDEPVTFSVEITNPATDANYSYHWYAEDIVTNAYMDTKETGKSITVNMPSVSTRQVGTDGYATVTYKCVIKDGDTVITEVNPSVRVLPELTYSKNLPETSHPFDKVYSLQAYKDEGAVQLIITFDPQTDTNVTIIDSFGKAQNYYHYYNSDAKNATVTVDGDSFVLLARNSGSGSYGYKVTGVKKVMEVPKVGTKHTLNNIVYKVTKSADKNGTVTVTGVQNKNLTKADIPAAVKISGYDFKVTAIDKNVFKNCKKLTSVKIGSNVTSIGNAAFSGCEKLKSVTLGAGVAKIGDSAFSGCKALTGIKLGAKVTAIGNSVFSGCEKLKSVTLGANVTKIGNNAFKGCKELTGIKLGAKVTTIGSSAFSGCKNLTTITITSKNLKKVGAKAFKGIAGKAKIKVPSAKLKAYKKLLKNKGQGKKVKITK